VEPSAIVHFLYVNTRLEQVAMSSLNTVTMEEMTIASRSRDLSMSAMFCSALLGAGREDPLRKSKVAFNRKNPVQLFCISV